MIGVSEIFIFGRLYTAGWRIRPPKKPGGFAARNNPRPERYFAQGKYYRNHTCRPRLGTD